MSFIRKPNHAMIVSGLVGSVFLIAWAPAKARANLLTNFGFETPDLLGGTSPGATGWVPFANNVIGSTTGITTTDELARTGENSFRTVQFGSGFNGIYQEFATSPGQTWKGSAWALNHVGDPITGTRAGAVSFQWFDRFGTNLGFATGTRIVDANSPTGGSANDFIFGEIIATAPAGAEVARFNIFNGFFQGSGNGTIFFDDASVTSVPEPGGTALASAMCLAVGGWRWRRRRSVR